MPLEVIRRGRSGSSTINRILAAAFLNAILTGCLIRKPHTTSATITTAGAGTYTAANLATGRILRDPNGAARTDTTDTATNLITGLGLTADYTERDVLVVNTADAAELITLAGGTGVTLKGAITIAQNTATRLAIMRTGVGAVTIREV